MSTASPRRRLRLPTESRALVAGEAFDLDFRPGSYWDDTDPMAAILRDIKGEARRHLVAEALLRGDDDIPDEMLRSALSEDDRTRWGHTHPVFMGGEYLPDLAGGATEIARIVLQSTLMDVSSLRARRVARGKHSGRLRFDLVDEYATRYRERFASVCAASLSSQALVACGEPPLSPDMSPVPFVVRWPRNFESTSPRTTTPTRMRTTAAGPTCAIRRSMEEPKSMADDGSGAGAPTPMGHPHCGHVVTVSGIPRPHSGHLRCSVSATTGHPHCGHAAALSDTSRPHSAHQMSIWLP